MCVSEGEGSQNLAAYLLYRRHRQYKDGIWPMAHGTWSHAAMAHGPGPRALGPGPTCVHAYMSVHTCPHDGPWRHGPWAMGQKVSG